MASCANSQGWSRDDHYWPPPPQIRTCATNASGSCLRYDDYNRLRVSATGRNCPAQCPVPAARTRMPFDQPPSLHLLRAALRRQFVRRLRRYYAAVRLPAAVHHRRTSLDFTMRPERRRWVTAGSPGSRASCFHACLGSPTARDTNAPCHCGTLVVAFPFPKQGRHSELSPFSRLNTQPTLSPVNASPRGLLPATHDSGPLWLARPLTYDSFIHDNLPVYPGALGKGQGFARPRSRYNPTQT
jgi:hypothetical protein